MISHWRPRFPLVASIPPRCRHLAPWLALASLATLSATRWAIGLRPEAILLGSLALTSAIDGLVLVAMRWGRSESRSVLHVLDPLRDLGIVSAAAAFALALAAASLSLDSYPTAVSALLLIVPALVASAILDRWRWRTYAAIAAAAAAAYLTMFELGRGRAGHMSSLGVLATLLSLTCWAIERDARRLRDEWKPIFQTPARRGDRAGHCGDLARVGLALALLLASLPFLLLIKSLPRPEWLYPVLGLMTASLAFAVVPRWGEHGLMIAAVVAGFAAWAAAWSLCAGS